MAKVSTPVPKRGNFFHKSRAPCQTIFLISADEVMLYASFSVSVGEDRCCFWGNNLSLTGFENTIRGKRMTNKKDIFFLKDFKWEKK